MTGIKKLVLALLWATQPAAAIIGGQPISASEYGYIVSLYADHGNEKHPPATPVCTGMLLPKNVVLTAASCVHEIDAKKGRVGIGNKSYAWNEVTWHGSYNRQSHEHNVAIVTFRGTHKATAVAKLSTKHVRQGDNLTMVGLASTGSPPRRIKLPVISRDVCHHQLKGILSVGKDNFCTAGCSQSERGMSSAADTGGPILRDDGTVVGITSVDAGGRPRDCRPRAFTGLESHSSFVGHFYDTMEGGHGLRLELGL